MRCVPDDRDGAGIYLDALEEVQVQTQRLQFAGNRDEVRHQSVRVGLSRLLEFLTQAPPAGV